MHHKGFPLFLIKKKIGKLEAEINKILTSIVDFTFQIDLVDNEKKGADLYFYRKFAGAGGHVKVPVRNCSGFEKFIMSIAIRIGLYNISNYMIPNFIIIDEGFGTMDNSNLSKLGAVFENIRQKFELILLITHKEELKEQLKNRIKIDNYQISF